jgi:pimeloyl-ACP methyl ester carboxylesterase
MVLTAPHRSLRDIYLFNTAFTFYPQPRYEETMTWDATQHGTRFDIPFFLLHGDSDQHTLTSLVIEYFAAVEAPVKDLVLIPGGGHCAVLMQPDVILTHLRAKVTPSRQLRTAPDRCCRHTLTPSSPPGKGIGMTLRSASRLA